jgi:NADH-quinone oxidoreductase subunit L
MGGLRRELPITYWTFLVGALAIAGVPLLSGFFSKDEILFRTFASGHTMLWVIGLLTSLLTAIYMFRLVFLAFHGERRHAAPPEHPEEEEPVAHAHDAHAHGHAHGHGTPHDAPPSMAIPLIVLAIGSIFAGYVGVPHALGGSNRIETFLEPSFEVSESARRTTPVAAEGAPAEPGGTLHTAAAQAPAHGAEEAHADPSVELLLMGISSGIALAGIGIAMFFWLRRPDAADAMARRFKGLYTLLYNKYYVDELYDAAFVQPIRMLSTNVLWKGVDAGAIDGAVNGVGLAVRGASGRLRRIQTGSVRTYAASLFLGVVVILGYYLLG